VTSDCFVACEGSRRMGEKAADVPASLWSNRTWDERGRCPVCFKYYTTVRGILPRHGYTKPEPKAECAGQLAMTDV